MRRLLALSALCLLSLAVVPALATADTGNIIEPQGTPPTNADGWQAGTCLTNEPVAKVKCGPQTGGAFFKTAAGHPPIGFTNYIIQHGEITEAPLVNASNEPLPAKTPVTEITAPTEDRNIKTLQVDLPPGLTVNPNAAPKCSLEDFENMVGEFHVPLCSPESKVGTEEVTLVVTVGAVIEVEPGVFLPKGAIVPPSEASGTKVNVYNLEPKAGEPALFGFVVAGKEEVFLTTQVAWDSDFHESFRIELPPAAPPFETLVSRLVNFGATTGDGTYINNPTTCLDPTAPGNEHLYSTWFRAESFGEPDSIFPNGSTPIEAKVEENNGGEGVLVQQEGCDTVPFTPGITVDPGTASIDSPAPATVTTTLEYLTGEESTQQESHLRKAVISLPDAMGINPSGAVGLAACTDAQFNKGVRTYANSCPANSVIGSAEITSPPLERPLKGSIFIGEQKSSDPASGEQFRILVEAKEPNEGIAVRLVGHVAANPVTGKVTTTFDEQEIGPLAGNLPQGLPQVPFESVVLNFGARAVLTSPPTCSPAQASGTMEPWARPGEQVPVVSKFTLSNDPSAGATCPLTLAQRGFTPHYAAASDSTKAGAYSPFHVFITRRDGEQELKVVNVTLPPGLTGKLRGIPYCPDSTIAAAESKSAAQENAAPSCPEKSFLGTTTTTAGTGGVPLQLPGNVWLAGPYKGAPISLVVTTPASAGPFDLGVVVIRVALYVDPITAQVNAVSDPIPDVFGGVKVDVRSIAVDIYRKKFMENPTNCQTKKTEGTLNGGGANPADASAWSSYAVSAPFQPIGCKDLGFKPKLFVRLKGSTKRTGFPQLRAVLETRNGDANIARTALNLPHAFLVEQGHMGDICTRPKLASRTCPKNSIYGRAVAKSPLLSGKLEGPVYLVPGGHTLPDLVADLRGQVNIQLHGVISSKHGGIKTVFNSTPDVPVTKFILNMKGGKKGLIVNSADNTCDTKRQAILNIKGQNSRRVRTNHFRLNIADCPSGKKQNKQRPTG